MPFPTLATLHGEVVSGKRVGRTLGFPTANVAYPASDKRAPDGVYLAEVTLPSGEALPAILNQGRHPTLAEGAPTVEAHLLGFHGDLYGLTLTLRYVEYLRPERTFDSPEALKMQLREDVDLAVARFSEDQRFAYLRSSST